MENTTWKTILALTVMLTTTACGVAPQIKYDRDFYGADGEQSAPAEMSVDTDPGDRGDKGDRGDRGDLGDKADRGDRGHKGDRGDRGDRGDKGDRGDSDD